MRKHNAQKQIKEEMSYVAYTSISQFIIEESRTGTQTAQEARG